MTTPIPTDRRPREPRHGLRPSPTDSAVPPLAASPVLEPPPPVGGTASPFGGDDSGTEELQRHLNRALSEAIQARELLWDIAHRTDVVSPDNARVCDRTSQAIDAVRLLSELARDVRADARRARG